MLFSLLLLSKQEVRLYLWGVSPETEIQVLRWSAASNDLDTLAAVLDRSMVEIPAGEFIMGSNSGKSDAQPERLVYLDAFSIDRYEVTNAQYQRFLKADGRHPPVYWNGLDFPTGQPDRPVVGVGWKDAHDYCEWQGKRLPSEAEWEKACRGVDGRTFPWGEVWDEKKANVGLSAAHNWPRDLEAGWGLLQITDGKMGLPLLKPVGSYLAGASPYGALDLVGNVSEWVEDWYNWNGYLEMPVVNPLGLGPPWNHSLRGSAWYDRQGEAGLVEEQSRCSMRNSSHSYDDPRVGFRCAR